MQTIIRGRVWKFGDNIDTDVMAPWNSLSLGWEERRKVILHTRPEFVERVQPGDLIVAGRNWGCGSSREHAPENLKLLGISGVLAETFGRIYFRNCIAIAFPNLVCPGVHAACEDGDELEVDIATGRVRNLTRDAVLQAQTYTPEMMEIMNAGGLLETLKRRFDAGATESA